MQKITLLYIYFISIPFMYEATVIGNDRIYPSLLSIVKLKNFLKQRWRYSYLIFTILLFTILSFAKKPHPASNVLIVSMLALECFLWAFIYFSIHIKIKKGREQLWLLQLILKQSLRESLKVRGGDQRFLRDKGHRMVVLLAADQNALDVFLDI